MHSKQILELREGLPPEDVMHTRINWPYAPLIEFSGGGMARACVKVTNNWFFLVITLMI